MRIGDHLLRVEFPNLVEVDWNPAAVSTTSPLRVLEAISVVNLERYLQSHIPRFWLLGNPECRSFRTERRGYCLSATSPCL